jgi:hypothetical protein
MAFMIRPELPTLQGPIAVNPVMQPGAMPERPELQGEPRANPGAVQRPFMTMPEGTMQDHWQEQR